MTLKVLVLGGTGESRLLGERLAADERFDVLLSFAGRTKSLPRPTVPHRIGGFGGAHGLGDFLMRGRFGALIDVTHPFAARISANAVQAAQLANIPVVRLERPGWQRQPGDRWLPVASMEAAAAALGADPQRVFLSVGRQELGAFCGAPQHDYLVRAIEPFELELPLARVILQRGPFELANEVRLLEQESIDVVVSKDSGTDATYPKIEAARRLGLPVILVERPTLPPAPLARDIDGILVWLDRVHRTERGE